MNSRVSSAVLALSNVVPARLAAQLRSDARLSALLRPLLNRLLVEDPVRITVRSGLNRGRRVLVLPREEKFYWTGSWELATQRVLSESLLPGQVFWDVGSHIGFLALVASSAIGERGKVVCFEPHPENLVRLRQTIKLNDLRNIEIVAKAVAATSGCRNLVRGRTSTTWSLGRTVDSQGDIAVETTTLDEALESHPAPAVVKIDVEGAELDVLRGARLLISKVRPILIVEISQVENLDAVSALLPDYRLTRIEGKNWCAKP